MKTALAIALAVIAQAVGNTLLSKGMKVVASIPDFSDGFSLMMLSHAMQSPLIWGGVVLQIVFFASFLSALSWADLSFVVPATAAGYILNVFFGSYFLDEPVSQARWLGSVLICFGVVLVSLSGSKAVSNDAVQENVEPGPRETAC